MTQRLDDATLHSEDEAARRRCCERWDGALVLEAGAGTGKTAVLVARILAWCLGRGWQQVRSGERAQELAGDDERVAARVLEGVVAFTFTERAALEMAERVGEWLGELAAGRLPAPLALFDGLEEVPVGAARAARARALLASIDRLTIGTIHGYCRGLLSRFSLAAGRHPGRDEVDAEGRLVAAVVEEVLGEALPVAFGDPGDADALALAADGAGPAALATALEELIAEGVRPASLAAESFSAPAVRACAERLAAYLERLTSLLGPALYGKRGRRLQRANQALAEAQLLIEEVSGQDDAERLSAAARGCEAGAIVNRLGRWRRGQLSESEREALGASADELVALAGALDPLLRHLASLQVERLRRAQRVLLPLLARAEEALARRGISTFGALVRDARDLLEGDRVVRRRSRREMRQLLVDEFQDTDPLQGEIVRLLALEGPLEERPGLMIVGDPKQSIYGWRGADLSAYEAFVAEVAAQGGERLRLSLNFRSLPPILEEVERVFESAMRAEAGLQPPFARLLPARAAKDEAQPTVEYWVVPAQIGSAEEGRVGEAAGAEAGRVGEAAGAEEEPISARRAREVEAAALVDDLIERQRAGELAWGDVALLLRATTHQEIYLRALRRAGVPYLVERDRSYYRRREVIEAAALLRTVLETGDPIALVTLLRSGVSGVPDAALLPLWRAGLPALADGLGRHDPAQEREEVDALLDGLVVPRVPGIERVAGWRASARATLLAVGALRRARDRMPLDRWLDALRATLPLELGEVSRFLGAHRLANLERFFARALEVLAGGAGGAADAAELVVNLRRDITGGREEQEAPVGDETLDAVRVLTIHRAKGLTFDHVYLLGTHGVPRGRASERSEWIASEGGWEGKLLGAPTLGYERLRRHRQRVGEAEEVRTLYVAMTRPRQRLVLAGRFSREGGAPAGSHAALLAARPGAERAIGVAAAGEERREGTTRWRPLRPSSPRRRRLEAAEPAIDTAAMADELARLSQRRAQALARQRRPLTRAVVDSAAEERGLAAAEAAAETSSRGARAVDDEVDGARRREVARAVGSAVHGVIEQLALERPLGPQLQAWSRSMERLLPPLPADVEAAAREQLELWLRRLEGSRLLAELHGLQGRLLGREVPVLLAAEPGDEAIGALTGSVDALLQDPVSDELVIVDFKTERVGGALARDRAERYRGQLARYAKGVQRALSPRRPPRCELWFLWGDVRVVL